MISKILAASAVTATALAGYSNVTVITTDVTVTDFVTYCPEETTITITKCTQDKCHAEETKLEPGTVTITGECVIPTTVTKHETETVIECVECEEAKTTEASKAPQTEAEVSKVPQTTVTECVECEKPTTLADISKVPEHTAAEESKPPVPTYEGAAGKAAVGAFAGVAAVAAALL